MITSMGAKQRLLSYFQEKVRIPLAKDDLAEVAAVHDWARVIRTLRQEGWDIELLMDGSYKLNSLEKGRGRIRGAIDAKLRYEILQRDGSMCQRCGSTLDDGVKLMVDHKVPVDLNGETTAENLWVLCDTCNFGKKHWFNDGDSEVLKKIFNLKSGFQRIKYYFETYPDQVLDIASLKIISGIRDWERTLRSVREKEKMNIKYVAKDAKTGKEGYIYLSN